MRACRGRPRRPHPAPPAQVQHACTWGAPRRGRCGQGRSGRAGGGCRAAAGRREGLLLGAAGLGLGLGLPPAGPARAFGPLDGITDAKRRSNLKFWIAPPRLARDRLIDAERLARAGGFGEAREQLVTAAQDCLIPEQGSVVDLQQRFIDTCTFRILVKNAPKRAAEFVEGSDLDRIAVVTNAKTTLADLIESLEEVSGEWACPENGRSARRRSGARGLTRTPQRCSGTPRSGTRPPRRACRTPSPERRTTAAASSWRSRPCSA